MNYSWKLTWNAWAQNVELHSLGKKFGEKTILNNFNYNFREHIGIIGKMGLENPSST